MFRLLTLLVLVSANLHATDKIQTVMVTIPVLHTWDEGGVKLARIPYTGWDVDNPYYSCAFYSLPFHSIPKAVFENEKHLKQDINLISVYGITVDSNYHKGITHITVRTGKAKKPETHKLTVGEVVKLAVNAVKEDFSDEKRYVIKVSDKPFKRAVAEQAGVYQPAAAPGSKPEDKKKPKSESEVRPQ